MIVGGFSNPHGRPTLDGLLYVPRFDLQHWTRFVVDTGADTSTIMPVDWKTMGLNLGELQDYDVVHGVGGVEDVGVEPATLYFFDSKYVFSYHLAGFDFADSGAGLPSLLGRDVLDQWRMVYHPAAGRLTFTPITWDKRKLGA